MRTTIQTTVWVLSLSLLNCNFALATSWIPKSGEVVFNATAKPGFLKIRGEAKDKLPQGTIRFAKGAITGEMEFDLNDFDTGIKMRNEHMKEKYLEVAKYPKAKLVLKPISVSEEQLQGDLQKDFSGLLTLHGETKEVKGSLKYGGKDKKLAAFFDIQVPEFNIQIPKHMGIVVGESVKVEVALQLETQN